MSATNVEYVGGGIGTTGLLGVVFVTLKLLGVINWSWAWVLAPFWLPVAVFLAAVFGVLLLAFIMSVASKD